MCVCMCPEGMGLKDILIFTNGPHTQKNSNHCYAICGITSSGTTSFMYNDIMHQVSASSLTSAWIRQPTEYEKASTWANIKIYIYIPKSATWYSF